MFFANCLIAVSSKSEVVTVPRPVIPRAPMVIISDHAHERWLERAKSKPKRKRYLTALVKRVLYAHLCSKGVATEDLTIALDLGGGIRAVLRLDEGVWVCITVIRGKDDLKAV
jgi:hypothetical protein